MKVKNYLRSIEDDKKKSLLVRIDAKVFDALSELDKTLAKIGMAKIPRSKIVEDSLSDFVKKAKLEIETVLGKSSGSEDDKNKDSGNEMVDIPHELPNNDNYDNNYGDPPPGGA